MRKSLIRVYVHLVWATWDRLPLIVPEIQRRLYAAMCAKCREFGCPVYAIGGIEDHVHVLIGLHPSVAVFPLVRDVKGSSSHLASSELLPNGFFKWQGAYGAFAVEHENVPRIIAYIRNQKEHHASHTIDPKLEEFLTEEDGHDS